MAHLNKPVEDTEDGTSQLEVLKKNNPEIDAYLATCSVTVDDPLVLLVWNQDNLQAAVNVIVHQNVPPPDWLQPAPAVWTVEALKDCIMAFIRQNDFGLEAFRDCIFVPGSSAAYGKLVSILGAMELTNFFQQAALVPVGSLYVMDTIQRPRQLCRMVGMPNAKRLFW